MGYAACYGTVGDRRPSRVAAEDALGTHLDAELAAWMRERIARQIDVGDAAGDRVNGWEICEACRQRGWTLGTGRLAEDAEC